MKGLYDNEMKLEFSSKTSNEAFARVAVAAFASQLDPTIDELSDIKTAVSEAVTNSIIHGYGEDDDGIVKIEAKIFLDTVQIEISDTGKGIEDIEMAMRPLYTSKPELERSGMGFTIMESFMDEIKVESALGFGTKVFLKKKITAKVNENTNNNKYSTNNDNQNIESNQYEYNQKIENNQYSAEQYSQNIENNQHDPNQDIQYNQHDTNQDIQINQHDINQDLEKIKNDIKNILEA